MDEDLEKAWVEWVYLDLPGFEKDVFKAGWNAAFASFKKQEEKTETYKNRKRNSLKDFWW